MDKCVLIVHGGAWTIPLDRVGRNDISMQFLH